MNYSDAVLRVTQDYIEPMVIGEMFGPKARAWFEKWKASPEYKQICSAERMAYNRLRARHPSIKKLDRRTLIGRKYLEDKKSLYNQFVAYAGKMPDDEQRRKRNMMLSGIKGW